MLMYDSLLLKQTSSVISSSFFFSLLSFVLLDLFFSFSPPTFDWSTETKWKRENLAVCNYLNNKLITCSLIDFKRRKSNNEDVQVNNEISSLIYHSSLNNSSRLDSHQPVSIQPGVSDDVYTFDNHWHSSLLGSFNPCYRGVCVFIIWETHSSVKSLFF